MVGLGPIVCDGSERLLGRRDTFVLWTGRCVVRGPHGLARGLCPPLTNGVVHCIRDRTRGSITFVVDGHDCGIAYEGVPDDVVLHAVAALGWSCDSVELL